MPTELYLYIVLHHHRHGQDIFPVMAEYDMQAIERAKENPDMDFEEEREDEYLEAFVVDIPKGYKLIKEVT